MQDGVDGWARLRSQLQEDCLLFRHDRSCNLASTSRVSRASRPSVLSVRRQKRGFQPQKKELGGPSLTGDARRRRARDATELMMRDQHFAGVFIAVLLSLQFYLLVAS